MQLRFKQGLTYAESASQQFVENVYEDFHAELRIDR
jgi:hypothetical protein